MTGGQADMFEGMPASQAKHRTAFETFHKTNPRVYGLFCAYTLEIFDTGRKSYSADAIVHRIRWHVEIETRSDDDFKINNNFVAFYARKAMREIPKLKDFFHTRRSAADR